MPLLVKILQLGPVRSFRFPTRISWGVGALGWRTPALPSLLARYWAGLPDDSGGMGARTVYLLVSQSPTKILLRRILDALTSGPDTGLERARANYQIPTLEP